MSAEPDTLEHAFDGAFAGMRRARESFSAQLSPREVGTVTSIATGIAKVSGLPGVGFEEILRFPGDVYGIAFNVDEDEIGVVLLGDYWELHAGDEVERRGHVMDVPVGDELIGRIVNPLGRPLDGLGTVACSARLPTERSAPHIMDRAPVTVPLQTGIKVIDALIPIGRGQRELIVGDRQTGKTAIAIDTILNQRGNWESGDPARQVKCVYVAVGQKGSTIAQVRQALEDGGALDYTTIVAAPASDPAGYKYLAPFTGSAIGQHWMYNGQHVLIIFDDLSKQAEAYRAISLLLRRPPGREAYPGDVFYLHSRLLERCAKLSDELGGGSLTGLPIVETKGNDVSAYIPTNVISITDGQIFLQSDLFFSGVRPAVNVGISVSRVGGSAQTKAMKKVAGRLRLDLAQYRELEAFAQFGSELDRATQQALTRGEKMVATLNQPQYQPWPMEEQVVAVYAGVNGYLDDIPTPQVQRFQDELREHLRAEGTIYQQIKDTGELPDELAEKLNGEIEKFKHGFNVEDERALV